MELLSQGSDAQRYVDSALNLRRSIERNRLDAEFAAAGNEIVYLFDTNVFIFNAYVLDSGSLSADLDNLVGDGEGRADLSKAMARLTADFIFSGRLPGQRNGKGYITLQHFEESLDKASDIGRTLEAITATASPMSEEGIKAQVAAVLNSSGSIEEKLRQLGELLPKAWMAALDARGHFRRALRECFVDPGTVVPLDRTAKGLLAGRVDHSDLQPWFNALPRPSRRRTPEAVRGDSQTLATIVNLYRGDEEARHPRRQRLYVLVTNDGTLASAVRDRRLLLAEEGIPNFIRSPRDYLPLLNLDSMSKAMDRVQPTTKMRAEFHRVFETLSTAIDWIAVMSKDPSAIKLLERGDGPLQELQDAWLAISEYVTVLNARHMMGEDSIFADLRSFITGEAERAATKMVETSVRSVRDKHLIIALNATLADLKRAAPSAKSTGPRRIHLQVIGDIFAKLTPPGSDLNAYLDIAIHKGSLQDEAAQTIMQTPDHAETQLLAACVFMAADRWMPAVQAATRAVEALEGKGGPEPFDARYLLALSLRFSMRNRHDFDRAVALLRQNLSGYAERNAGTRLGWSRRLRDEMEMGSLFISAAIVQELSRTPTGEKYLGYKGGIDLFNEVASDLLANGVKALRNAFELLLESETFPAPSEERSTRHYRQFVHGLRMLATTNLVEAYIFEQIAPGLQGRAPTSAAGIHALLDLFDEEIRASEAVQETLLPTQYIYYWQARALSARTPAERKSALEELDSHLKAVLSRHDLPVIDVLEFGYIAARLLETVS